MNKKNYPFIMQKLRVYFSLCFIGIAFFLPMTALATTSETIITPNTLVNGDNIGKTVSLNGEYAFISYGYSPGKDYGGRVGVFKFINGEWEPQQVIHQATTYCDAGGHVNYSFGMVLASQDEWLFIGAPDWKTTCANTYGNVGGTVFIYKRDGEQYVQHQKMGAPAMSNYPLFGDALSVSGDWLFVGSKGLVASSVYGAAYAYQYNGATDLWEYKQSLDKDGDATRSFGSAVSVDGNRAMVSSDAGISLGGFNIDQRGLVYCYELNNGTWELTEKLEYSKPEKTNAGFGKSIAMSGDIAVIGTKNDRTVSIYHFEDGNWELQQVVEKATESSYGFNVAVEEDYVLVSSQTGTAAGGQSTSGVVYLYYFDGDEWMLDQVLVPSDAVYGGNFGESIALDQGKILVGSPSHAYPDYKGQAYCYTGAIATPPVPSLIAKFSKSDAIIGIDKDVYFTDLSIAENTTITSWSWDFNGDGIEDSDDQNPVYQFNYPGVSTISLTVSDGNVSATSHSFITVLSASEDTCFVYIPFQGLERNGMGAAAWNVIDENGFEQGKVGHELSQPPASIQVAYYYLASRDYGEITPDSKGVMHALEGIQGWPNLSQALMDNGFTPEDLTVTFGLTTLGDDIQGQDWQIYGNFENRTYTGGMFNISIDGERIIHGIMPDFEMNLEYYAYLGGNDKIWGKTKQAAPNNSTGKESSQEAVNVAAAFMEDCGEATLMFLFSSIQPANQFEFSGHSRSGGFFDVEQGFIIKSCPFTSSTEANPTQNHEIQIMHRGNNLHFKNIPEGSQVKLYDLTAKLLVKEQIINDIMVVPEGLKGVYLIYVEGENSRAVQKIMIP